MSMFTEHPSSALTQAPSVSARVLSGAARQRGDTLDRCVEEFTRRLQAWVALPEDDAHFWERVRADISALGARCQPEDTFAFQLKAARVLADFGFATCPRGVLLASAQDTTPPPFAGAGCRHDSGTRAA